MKLGLNLSFAVKRWLDPVQLARMIKQDFGTDHVQFTWDLIDPWWPEEYRDVMVDQYKKAFADEGVEIDGTFGGLASYSYAHLLAPAREQREAALVFFKRAIDLTVRMGCPVMGTPVGGMTYDDARDPKKREELYQDMLESLRKLAAYGKEKGLKEIHIEATPLITEFPHSPEVSVKMMQDLEGSKIPIKLLVDWGHALFKPLLKEEADIELWFNKCAPYIGSIHLQQTDGLWDRHWDFTHEGGIVTPELIRRATENAHLDDIPQYLEVVTIFEDDDDHVYEGMKKTMDYLHRELG
ncbi:sugar phosphate isomerase/epimerase [Faecalicatena contorta]|uniref:Sugar phosphate isomerase/epimerase n=1 Tax=Faecalicatena fissicatena TaxID=290055 RepID=A0ABS2E9J2_9FIRM|nr:MULTISPECIES: TIM barrel protein [Clostridia]MBM6685373.1 sugar phosphate isomerase/epimerase [Faecalicatena contorta]MBM6711132.1 sugar phosphate isomerase/epimerase [Faecalicatena contorta]MBM6738316.1 sugar phosphate isomerase/epimerase [Faecalicatena fissicatena]HIX98531.1 sugar phosphate isomerase/epimerase [Candidatus Dorea intestinigallinarum]